MEIEPTNVSAEKDSAEYRENSLRDEQITNAVRQVLRIEDVTWGSRNQKFLVRFRGRLYSEDTSAAYDRLAADLRPMDITPLFRWDGDQHAVVLMSGVIEAKSSRHWVNLILFIITLLSVLLTGALYGMEEQIPSTFWGIVTTFIRRGWPFAVSLIAILGAHEFGHYLMGRYHGLNVTLPYFIPMPLSPFGTMGAFINMRDIPKNRKVLLDVGIAGPFAGLVIAIPVLILGLFLSETNTLPAELPEQLSLQMEGNSLLYLMSKYLVFGQLLPEPISYGGLPKLLYWLRYFFTGQPFPFGGYDVLLHPVAWAGWAGLLVTGLNLIPAGQLDGGHVINVLLGQKMAKRIYPFILVALVVLGFFWPGWWLWAFLLLLLGRVVAEPLDQITPLDGKRKALGVLALIVFVLTFTPVPLILL